MAFRSEEQVRAEIFAPHPVILPRLGAGPVAGMVFLIALSAALGNLHIFSDRVSFWLQPAQLPVLMCGALFGWLPGLLAALAAAPREFVSVTLAMLFHVIPGEESLSRTVQALEMSRVYIPASQTVLALLSCGPLTGWLTENFRARHIPAMLAGSLSARILYMLFPAFYLLPLDQNIIEYQALLALPQALMLAPLAKFISDKYHAQ